MTKQREKKVTIHLYVKEKSKDMFDRAAKAKNMSLTSFIEEATKQYISAEEQIESFKQKTLWQVMEEYYEKKKKLEKED